jgi:hypothetical protein
MAKVAETPAQQPSATATGSAVTGTAQNAVQQESNAVGVVYDKAMEYHVREGTFAACFSSLNSSCMLWHVSRWALLR